MITLGISAHFHDAAAALVKDGHLVAFSKEERFTRVKHHAVYPREAIAFCLKKAGISADEVDEVVFYENPSLKFTRITATLLSGFPGSFRAFVAAMQSWLTDKLWMSVTISRELGIHPRKIKKIPHHLSHIAQAFLPSPFEQAAFMTLDGIGEWTSLATGLAVRMPQMRLSQVEQSIYPHSMGLVYAAFTAFLGWKPNSQECNTMALAAFGEPTYKAQMEALLKVEDGKIQLSPGYLRLEAQADKVFTTKFLETFGMPRAKDDPIPLDSLDPGSVANLSGDLKRHADIAASLQLVLEEILLDLARRLHERTQVPNLCLAGGIALNAVAMGRLVRESPFENIFIAPDPGDAGAAVGAAFYQHQLSQAVHPPTSRQQTYPGFEEKHLVVKAFLGELEPQTWTSFQRAGVRSWQGGELQVHEEPSEAELLERIGQALQAGKIVGWYQGRGEAGPRALGNRSILADPGNLETALRLSKLVKSRAAWRPYAISLTEEAAGQLFDFPDGRIPLTARYMQMVEPVKEQAQAKVQAALHIDGTTRPQVCLPEDNPLYHALLQHWGKLTGLGALLNTSFNESGYPMINTSLEALLMFARTDMDVLVLHNTILEKTFTHVVEEV
ncbi:MAG: carbamoyltransferase N-terminal domain-containing protein [Bacteroidota bacterium]